MGQTSCIILYIYIYKHIKIRPCCAFVKIHQTLSFKALR